MADTLRLAEIQELDPEAKLDLIFDASIAAPKNLRFSTEPFPEGFDHDKLAFIVENGTEVANVIGGRDPDIPPGYRKFNALSVLTLPVRYEGDGIEHGFEYGAVMAIDHGGSIYILCITPQELRRIYLQMILDPKSGIADPDARMEDLNRYLEIACQTSQATMNMADRLGFENIPMETTHITALPFFVQLHMARRSTSEYLQWEAEHGHEIAPTGEDRYDLLADIEQYLSSKGTTPDRESLWIAPVLYDQGGENERMYIFATYYANGMEQFTFIDPTDIQVNREYARGPLLSYNQFVALTEIAERSGLTHYREI